jgi:hypothetical protein
MVKRLDDAIRDGDPVQAVIRGSACNHCGRSEGITMPSRSAQEKLLWRVHESAGLNPSDTPVVEVRYRASYLRWRERVCSVTVLTALPGRATGLRRQLGKGSIIHQWVDVVDANNPQ